MAEQQPPKSRDELLALPVMEIAPSDSGFHLAVIKVEGSTYAAKDDDGEWWVLELEDDGWARRSYPCRPW